MKVYLKKDFEIKFRMNFKKIERFYWQFDIIYVDKNEYFFYSKTGSKVYFNLNGNVHRNKYPAMLHSNGAIIYFNNGLVSRLDGFAMINHPIKGNQYYIDNLKYDVFVFAEKTNHKLCKMCNDFCKQECFI